MGADLMSDRKPLASSDVELAVIVPCHNVEATLGRQLAALVEQDWHGSWIIVVVDNGSSDETSTVAKRFADRGVHVLRADDGRGVAYARNAGARAVRARSVAFCDGDDVVHPGWVSALGEALRDHELVVGTVESSSLNPPWLAASRPMAPAGELPRFGTLPFARGNACGMRRSLLLETLGGFDESFVGLEDIELSLRAHHAGVTPVLVPEAVVAYRFRDSLVEVWRQGTYYGRGRPALVRTMAELGLPVPSLLSGLRSWLWLLWRLPGLRTRSGRYLWVWVLANRIGVLRGIVAGRSRA